MSKTVGSIANLVRAKNAGPFWITLDIFLENAELFDELRDSKVLSPDAVAKLYRVDPATVRIFYISSLNVAKISFPRRVTQGSFEDSDMHSGQQHVPLMSLSLNPSAAHESDF